MDRQTVYDALTKVKTPPEPLFDVTQFGKQPLDDDKRALIEEVLAEMERRRVT